MEKFVSHLTGDYEADCKAAFEFFDQWELNGSEPDSILETGRLCTPGEPLMAIDFGHWEDNGKWDAVFMIHASQDRKLVVAFLWFLF